MTCNMMEGGEGGRSSGNPLDISQLTDSSSFIVVYLLMDVIQFIMGANYSSGDAMDCD